MRKWKKRKREWWMIGRQFLLICPVSSGRYQLGWVDCVPYSDELYRSLFDALRAAYEVPSLRIQVKHLLMGILQNPNCVGYKMLETLGIQIEELLLEVQNFKPSQEGGNIREYRTRLYGFIPIRSLVPRYKLTFRAELACILGYQEADLGGSSEVNTGHLLLGILNEGITPASCCLRRYPLTLEQGREYLRQNKTLEANSVSAKQPKS